jgi:hypothetical protein
VAAFVHEAFALVIEHDPRQHTGIDHPVFSELLHLTGECPTIVTRIFAATTSAYVTNALRFTTIVHLFGNYGLSSARSIPGKRSG